MDFSFRFKIFPEYLRKNQEVTLQFLEKTSAPFANSFDYFPNTAYEVT